MATVQGTEDKRPGPQPFRTAVIDALTHARALRFPILGVSLLFEVVV